MVLAAAVVALAVNDRDVHNLIYLLLLRVSVIQGVAINTQWAR